MEQKVAENPGLASRGLENSICQPRVNGYHFLIREGEVSERRGLASAYIYCAVDNVGLLTPTSYSH